MNTLPTISDLHVDSGSTSIVDKFARSALFSLLKRLERGQITIIQGSDRWTFGIENDLAVHVTVHKPSFYRKTLFGGSIGGAEAYIEKIWEVDDLTTLVRIMVLNMGLLDRLEKGLAWLQRPLELIAHLRNANSKKGARRNILAHYDIGNDLYRSFLDPTMMYSSAIFPEKESSLEQASLHKLETICKKLQLKPADHIVEIGSGWGGFAIYAASHYGCRVTTTTISDAQYDEARRRIDSAGLSDKITLLKKDYRDLTGQYDKLVSIEMIEAVGHRFMPIFFKKCCELLKPDGKMLIQAITISDQKYDQYANSVDFIQKYIFPGGCLPSNNRMLKLIAEKTDMIVRRIDDFGFHYALTLKEWRNRFNQSFPKLRNGRYDDAFRRLWEFYLCYCEGGFMERSISVVHLVATRPESRDE